ncbi:DUF899 family protein [Nocardia miyunensis]|uniref:DUF899 family protein n=1 Tax=Nocardia miyunensis TaxID=282684 RepID=UPI000836C10E|nr:DUF899 family protein [Nocardia miyunensis]
MPITFPSESQEYREARDVLLRQEVDLRRRMEAVAAQRRSLPPGSEVPEDYVFDRIGDDGAVTTVRMSELFGDSDTLMLYHYMFPRHPEDHRPRPTKGIFSELPTGEGPCPSCTALIDMWDATRPHFDGSDSNLAIVAKAPIERVAAFAQARGWRNTPVLSAANSNFRRDYGGDGADGSPAPMLTVFKLWPDGRIRLHWASELILVPTDDPGQDSAHPDTVEPLWTLFDLATMPRFRRWRARRLPANW